MLLFALTIFTSAFLLFLVQPIIAKQILPWFGGSAAVWTTCLVFFQTALLAGYAYADVVVRRLDPRRQTLLHIALLIASVIALPIIPGAFWKPEGSENPAALILGMLTVTLGLPYFLLSTTSPLLQAWFAQRYPARSVSPVRPVQSRVAARARRLSVRHRAVDLDATQAYAWSAGYAAFVVLCVGTAWGSLRVVPAACSRRIARRRRRATRTTRELSARRRRSRSMRSVLWCSLAAAGSVLLLSVSNHITQNIAAVPLLWIVPLTLYLLTFILTFDGTAGIATCCCPPPPPCSA